MEGERWEMGRFVTGSGMSQKEPAPTGADSRGIRVRSRAPTCDGLAEDEPAELLIDSWTDMCEETEGLEFAMQMESNK
jgi:hypothetical protein